MKSVMMPQEGCEAECPYFHKLTTASKSDTRIILCEGGRVSLPIKRALHFKNAICGKNYEQCPIYQELEAHYYEDVYGTKTTTS